MKWFVWVEEWRWVRLKAGEEVACERSADNRNPDNQMKTHIIYLVIFPFFICLIL